MPLLLDQSRPMMLKSTKASLPRSEENVGVSSFCSYSRWVSKTVKDRRHFRIFPHMERNRIQSWGIAVAWLRHRIQPSPDCVRLHGVKAVPPLWSQQSPLGTCSQNQKTNIRIDSPVRDRSQTMEVLAGRRKISNQYPPWIEIVVMMGPPAMQFQQPMSEAILRLL